MATRENCSTISCLELCSAVNSFLYVYHNLQRHLLYNHFHMNFFVFILHRITINSYELVQVNYLFKSKKGRRTSMKVVVVTLTYLVSLIPCMASSYILSVSCNFCLLKKTCIAYFDNGYRSIKIQLAFCRYCDFFNLWILFKIKQSKELDVTLNNLKFLPYITIRKVLFDWFSTHVLYLISGMNVLQLCHATTSQRGLHLNFFCSVYPTGSSGPKEVSFHSL